MKSVVLGLIARQRHVALVTDALGHWNASEAELALRQMAAKGAIVTTTDEVIGGREFHFPLDLADELNIPAGECFNKFDIVMRQLGRGEERAHGARSSG